MIRVTCYITNGVLIGLHRHKAGQYLAIQKVTSILLWFLALVIVASFLCTGDGGQKASIGKQDRMLSLSSGPRSVLPPSLFDFPIGYVGPTRIVKSHGSVFAPEGLPEFGFTGSPAPGVFGSPHRADNAVDSLSTNSDFGLPELPPLWRFTERGLPAGIVHEDITLIRPADVLLVSPAWPKRVWLVNDTAIVEGLLTFHAHGLLSFELVSESHPGLAFGAAVQEAIYQSTCFPSIDNSGNRITVCCRYRCLFVQGAQSSVSVGPSVTARIKED